MSLPPYRHSPSAVIRPASTPSVSSLSSEGSIMDEEHSYFQGFKEGLRRRDTDIASLEDQVRRLTTENAELKLRVEALQGVKAQEFSLEATDSRNDSSSDDSSFVGVSPPSPPSSRAAVFAGSARATSIFPRGGRVNDKYGIPNYLSVFRSPETERALRELMGTARRMDVRALTRIKKMCREAHATPRHSKSWAQTFILSEWRNPPELAPPSTRDVSNPALPNPRMGDSFESWFHYYSVHIGALPRGVRRDTLGKPWKPDLRASRLAAQLRPLQTSPTATRTEFNYFLIELLGIRGEYQSMVRRLGFQIASELSPKPYSGPSPVAIEDVVSHMAACGISIETVTDDLEPWSWQYKAAGTMRGPKSA
ncbi:hypothetical protein VNI00_017900 [Paramarasmius palmivorus]|uniref:Uncharacterized protein n=1 Tax=Paramarasmius palmivorus TaxID=297713 RepID=A0AAW0B195_9AGAR